MHYANQIRGSGTRWARIAAPIRPARITSHAFAVGSMFGRTPTAGKCRRIGHDFGVSVSTQNELREWADGLGGRAGTGPP